jgi:DNA invertase Pin-like site-specific DNA recombinase
VDWFYDPAVKGSNAVTKRPGFKDMLDRIAGNGVRTIIVESPDRFARDLAVQLAGHDFLRNLGVALIPATAPDFFLEDTPTAVLVRQVLGTIAQFEKASLVAKLKAARDRKIAQASSAGGDLRGAITRAGRSSEGVAGGAAAIELAQDGSAPRQARLHRRFRRAVCRDVGTGNAKWLGIRRKPPLHGRGERVEKRCPLHLPLCFLATQLQPLPARRHQKGWSHGRRNF